MRLLNSEVLGEGGVPIILMHGLLGSSRNWRSVSKELTDGSALHCLDLRNHGNSFHDEDASIRAMSDDLLYYIEHHHFSEVILCGHSLGGKVAMHFACGHSTLVTKLIIADIAPRSYPPEHHIPTLDSLLSLDLSSLSSRKEADDLLSSSVSHWGFRQFLLTNLVQEGEGFRRKANIQVLRNSITELSSNPLVVEDRYDRPTLFIRGGKSGYLRSEHIPKAKQYFPHSQFEVLPHAGHDVHVEDRPGFLAAFQNFLFSA